MSNERKSLMAAAGAVGDAPNVADVFSTDVYTGTEASNHVINNGIDLDGEGGMVWIKNRDSSVHSAMLDTERGLNKISSSTTSGQSSSTDVSSFNSNGFTLGWVSGTDNADSDYVSWTFRKKEKFFDIQTYSGTGSAGLSVAHDLGVVPAFMLVKVYAGGTANWYAWSNQINSGNNYAHLNLTNAWETDAINIFGNGSASVPPTDTHFTIGGYSSINSSGKTYVAYLFADNSAEDADDQMIKCGMHSMPAGGGTVPIDLGWEPQFILMKDANHSQPWWLHDTTRGLAAPTGHANGTGGGAPYLFANSNAAESASTNGGLSSTGFTISSGMNYADGNTNYIYMAIRAPMMKEPSAGTDVFNIGTYGANRNNSTTDTFYAGFPVDMAIKKNPVTNNGTNNFLSTRMLGTTDLSTNHNGAERTGETEEVFDSNTHWNNAAGTSTNNYSWMWKRAKGYFDVVAYKGTGSPRTLAHSLGVVPEMIVCKSRSTTGGWQTYHKTTGNTKYLYWNQNYPAQTSSSVWNNTTPTDSVFTVGNGGELNGNNITYVAYLFASVAGISKVGSFSGSTGNVVNVECGFAPRFVLIKKHNGNGNWLLFDTVRGIVAGNDAKIQLDLTDAQNSATDYIDPYSTGFSLSLDTEINENGKSFIFYAIA